MEQLISFTDALADPRKNARSVMSLNNIIDQFKDNNGLPATGSPEDDDIRVLVRIREPAGAPWTMLVAVVILGIAATGLILRRRFRSDAAGTPPPAQAARPVNEPRGELN